MAAGSDGRPPHLGASHDAHRHDHARGTGRRRAAAADVALTVVQAVSLYWAVSGVFSLAQSILLRTPWIRRAIGIAETPSEVRIVHRMRALLRRRR